MRCDLGRKAILLLGCCMAAAAADSAELKQIYEADQADRKAANVDWAKVGPRDEARRQRVRAMLDAGLVITGKDYERAAMVYQHGDGSNDILLAHVLAVTAIGKGNLDARWLSAATLDRLLHRLKQPQVFGTQYQRSGDDPWTMEPYNRALLSEAVRDASCVPDEKDQAAMLAAIIRGEEQKPPARKPCAAPVKQTPQKH
ncbi:MAG: hypothetical protein IT162_00695 [Bryobacterales bacterium]|nr:hypothetical protein [Bryobacterales bacterium]